MCFSPQRPGVRHEAPFVNRVENEKLVIPSPVKDKPDAVNVGNRTIADLALKSQWSPARFTADFTPSRGNTPVHHKFSLGNLRVNKAPVGEGTVGSIPQPSPPDKKKKLSELFKESLRDDQYIEEETAARNKDEAPENVVPEATSLVQPPKFTNETPYLSGANSGNSSERTPNGVLKAEDKSVKSAQCCIPRLLSSRSFSERRKRTSPAPNVG
ncbi:UNVERIFIED_CONTAM: hypothetical protein Scaly_2088300 [Sesamum calycinum]|uniref:Uncharacterized protein n=1 Tax=Sesamum calycinum TaxID=2727403 RepID=A0AAW2MMX0_9LAMI